MTPPSPAPARPQLVALDGGCFTGKTTLATVLASQLGATAIPEYADLAPLPPYPPRILDDVHAGLDHLCRLEQQRADLARRLRTSIVLFDRSPLSCIAYQQAVTHLDVPADPHYAAGIFTHAVHTGTTLPPDRYLYLRLPRETVLARQRHRGPVQPHLVDPRFTAATDHASLRYLDMLPDDRRLILDADRPISQLAATAAAFLATTPTSPAPVAWTRMLDTPHGQPRTPAPHPA
ncbi:AAA family ATPase [Parafrankia elaeagni]|uniref:AAA family ATPase n=1 Tax=Parafrankia elaeagni TaxID=222534 RepID=UPI0003751F55|nr:AAA family ATPase [Parafrankia elaeagni]